MFFGIRELQNRINCATSEGKPFLFGINYEVTEGFFIENPLQQQEVLFNFNGIGNKTTQLVVDTAPSIELLYVDIHGYAKMFDVVQREIAKGRVGVINLTGRTPIKTSISEKAIFECSTALYQLYVPGRFVCFSPEIFVKIKEGQVSTFPMKGTIDAMLPNAKEQILGNEKEIEEHRRTVEAMSGDLSLVAKDVTVKRFRYVDRVQTTTGALLQTSSEIVGMLPDDYLSRMGDIIMALMPGISIVGSPKAEALEVIKLAEAQDRGYYCGIAGYFDGQTLDTCVLIRYIEIDGEQQFFRSGGGITEQSNCEKEYQELLNKIYLTCN